MSAPPVRVLYTEGNVDGTVGGSYYSLLYLLEGLDRSRITPTLVLRCDVPLVDRFRRTVGNVRLMKTKRPFSFGAKARTSVPALRLALSVVQRTANVIKFYVLVLKLAWGLRRDRVQLVHLNNSVISNHDWMLASMLARVPCVTHERGLNETYSGMARWCAPRLAAILCISQAVFDKLVEHKVAGDNLHLVPNGLDPDQFLPKRSAGEVRRTFGIADDQRVIGLVGNIREWKGQEIVIRALARVTAAIPNVTCLFVGEAAAGDEGYIARLHGLVAELGLERQVVFTGYCDNVADLVNVMEVSVHASVAPEPFGRVILEAMALRKPVIGSRGGAITEIVEEGVTGFTFPPRDADTLASHVTHLLQHPDAARALGEAGYQRLTSLYHVSSNVRRTMAIYADVLGAALPGPKEPPQD
jgi:glycosyltransferase involved in cell wall biosynthesis